MDVISMQSLKEFAKPLSEKTPTVKVFVKSGNASIISLEYTPESSKATAYMSDLLHARLFVCFIA